MSNGRTLTATRNTNSETASVVKDFLALIKNRNR